MCVAGGPWAGARGHAVALPLPKAAPEALRWRRDGLLDGCFRPGEMRPDEMFKEKEMLPRLGL